MLLEKVKSPRRDNMPTARNMQELQKMLMDELNKSMREVATKTKEDMKKQVEWYYEGTTPKQYVRTYHLKNTPSVTRVMTHGKECSFDAYLDSEYTYTTGKKPTMMDVLKLTNDFQQNSSVGWLRRGIGNPGYWERAKNAMSNSFDRILSSHFDKI